MPSQTSFGIRINIAPTNAVIRVEPESGESLFTDFLITVEGA